MSNGFCRNALTFLCFRNSSFSVSDSRSAESIAIFVFICGIASFIGVPGIIMSSRMRSGWWCSSFFRQSSALTAMIVLNPSCSSNILMVSRMSFSSSTIIIVFIS